MFFNAALVCLIIVSSALALTLWRRSLGRFAPTLICLLAWASVIVGGRLGLWSAVADWRFYRHANDYVRVVQSVRDGTIEIGKSDSPSIIVPNALPPNTQKALAERCTDGSLLVEFLDEGSSFSGHTGYLFRDSAPLNSCSDAKSAARQNWHLHRVKKNWYRFAN